MKIDKAPFLVHTIDVNNAKVLIWPDQAERAKGKNVIIGDDRPLTVDNKILAMEVIREKTHDRKKNLRIILKPHTLRGARRFFFRRPVCCSAETGRTGFSDRSDRPGGQSRTFKPKRPEVGTW